MSRLICLYVSWFNEAFLVLLIFVLSLWLIVNDEKNSKYELEIRQSQIIEQPLAHSGTLQYKRGHTHEIRTHLKLRSRWLPVKTIHTFDSCLQFSWPWCRGQNKCYLACTNYVSQLRNKLGWTKSNCAVLEDREYGLFSKREEN